VRLPQGRSVDGYVDTMMFAMFVLWIVAFLGVFLHRRWTIPVTLAALVWTAVILRLHMSSDIPLNF
jgi:hypothetical protein